jgi:leucyl-tRNA synthetase
MADFLAIESKWQKTWEEKDVFNVDDNVDDAEIKKNKYYCLEMFPYPSSYGLHMGHALNYTIGDVYARFKRMKGFNVLYPMGYDAFGLPAENAAIKAKEHPKKYTENSINNFINQQKKLGLSYDWKRMVVTCKPEYYKWNQYFFLKFLENGLAYRKKSAVNWCPECNTVLANEQVHDGKCWRHSTTDVQIKPLEQWFIKTTKYADELLECISSLEWPNRIKAMQENWIGKSFGTEVSFEINGEIWNIFTTRIDTIFGVTFMVISAQHPRLMEIVTPSQKSEVESFLKKLKSVSEKEMEAMEKEGAFTGSYAINPANGEKVPVFAGNFVVADYGGGMVMAVPSHDQRDFEFAKKYNIPIKVVITPSDYEINAEKMSRAFTDDGILVNSKEFDGTPNRIAIDDITLFLEKKGKGKKVVQYKLRDWLVSRQRYWGTPIPVIYCDKCGIVSVPVFELPIILPDEVKFGEGNPLLTNSSFVNCKCPKCGGSAKRETDTMDTFFDSSWYFLRYCDNNNSDSPFEKKKGEYFMPVDQYIGGAEHACMHLIYARFFTKVLRDMGMINIDEPFKRLFNQGMLHGSDGNKMSKSLGNVVNPLDIIDKYSADSLRFNLMSLASPDKDSMWSDRGMESSFKFISKIYSFFENVKLGRSSKRIESKINKTIRDYAFDIENFKYNLAIIKLRALFDAIEKESEISKSDVESFLKMIHLFCPHMTEELWSVTFRNNSFLSKEKWPDYDESKIDEKAELIEELADNVRSDIVRVLELAKIDKPNKITLFVSELWKYHFYEEMKSLIETNRDMKQLMAHFSKKFPNNMPVIQKIIPAILKDQGKIPSVMVDQKSEHDALLNAKSNFEKEFLCQIDIFLAESSQVSKAKQANPGKPAILIE